MADNEDAAPSLGDSEVATVQDPVGEPIPEFDQPPEEGSKRPSPVRRQHTGDVLPDDPAGGEAAGEAEEFEGEVPPVVGKSPTQASDGKTLTGGSPDQDIDA